MEPRLPTSKSTKKIDEQPKSKRIRLLNQLKQLGSAGNGEVISEIDSIKELKPCEMYAILWHWSFQ